MSGPEQIIIREIEPQIVVKEILKYKDTNSSSPFEKLLTGEIQRCNGYLSGGVQ